MGKTPITDEPSGDELDARLREHYAALPGETATVTAILGSGGVRSERDPLQAASEPLATSSRRALSFAGPSPFRRTIRSLVPPALRRLPRLTPAVRWATAASLMALAVTGVHVAGSVGERTAGTVREAAMNHRTRLAPEFPERDLAALDAAMTELPFELRRPERLGADWRLIGGRYCSIAGRLAAHVQLVAPDGGGTLSLFVTRESDRLARLDGERHDVDEVSVELWEEQGLFFAMARSDS